MPPIFLIGYMCSGKTTLGRALSSATGMAFIDLDEAVEKEAGMTVGEIFSTLGEKAFRRMEMQALQHCSEMTDTIVACGGGTPCIPGAMTLMNGSGITVFLRPCSERLAGRLMAGRAKRPLIAGIDTEEEMMRFASDAMSRRLPYYTLARYTFDSSLLETPREVEASVNEFINTIVNDRR